MNNHKPLAIDLYCGLGGWAEGFLTAGYRVVGFDTEAHDYGSGGYPGQLVIQDVLTLHGRQFKDAAVIVASPPCQKYSYMAMPWSKAKAIAAEYRAGCRCVKELNALFDACFRIQREASEAAGRYIPLIVENVRGAQPWVGRSAWNYGSFHLWGDVPALMPITLRRPSKNEGGSWFAVAHNTESGHNRNPVTGEGLKWGNCPGKRFDTRPPNLAAHQERTGRKTANHPNQRDGHSHTRHLTNPAEHEGIKVGGDWFGAECESSPSRLYGSKSVKRKAAAAQIAKIPFNLAFHIAQAYYPHTQYNRCHETHTAVADVDAAGSGIGADVHLPLPGVQ